MEALLKSLSQMEGPGGGGEKGGDALPQGIEAMLAGASSGALGANPFGLSDQDLKAMGGMEGFNKTATDLWKHLDDLSTRDPEAYKSYVQKQAQEAGIEKGAKKKGAADADDTTRKKAAPLKGATFVVSTKQVKKAAGKKKPSKTPTDAAVCLYRLIANSEKSGVKVLRAHSGGPVPAEVRERSPPYKEADRRVLGLGGDEGIAGLPVATEPVTVYPLEVHPEDLKKALTDITFRTILVESAFMFVETTHKVALNRSPEARKLFTLKEEASPEEARAAAIQQAAAASGLGSGLSSGLLAEISSLAAPANGKPQAAGGAGVGAPGAAPDGAKPKPKPLIMELGGDAAPPAEAAPAAKRGKSKASIIEPVSPPGSPPASAPQARAAAAPAV
eukprot:CAMPEP_0118923958 /NCGR_PEP_ID=MMETSP1169-20130426/2297_1 /TAXON_ID=36882 /ORGANISM="Pyramimonas obovata, Strain CCMP722" /LENGTH=388 /DNA_ID=CAMNT_0006865027 /DNA_START=432 /DNA_END=1595 /DNA_ORIENTATION=+